MITIKTLLITTLLSSGISYSTQFESVDECLKAKEEILKVNPEGVSAYCITESEKMMTKNERQMQELGENVARKLLVTFQAVLTQILMDIQRNGIK